MSQKTPHSLTPMEGVEALNGLMLQIAEAAAASDNAALDRLIGEIGEISEATGVELPGVAENLAALRGENAKISRYQENFDAAMWAGDMERANTMNEAGVDLNHDNIPGVPHPEEISEDDGYFDDIEFDDPEMQELIAGIGLAAAPEEPDLYADIAAGVPGAIGTCIASGEDFNKPRGEARYTALLAALDAPGRSAEKIERLIVAGADVRFIHEDGDNVLSWAAGYHHPETVTPEGEATLMSLLARHGANPHHAPDDFPWTPLHRAIVQGDLARVTGMLAAGGDPAKNIPEDFAQTKLAGFNCLMLAAPKPDVVRLLLRNGVDPAAPDAHGRQALKVIDHEASLARNRAEEDDPWTVAHAEALETSREILAAALMA